MHYIEVQLTVHMDFLDPKKRKAHRRRLFIGYGLVGILIAMVSVLMLFLAYGYSFNISSGKITQNGLLFVDASPTQANLFVNDEFKGATDKRLVLKEGQYDIELRRTGYETWRQSLVLRGGAIERFQYAFLFPENPQSNEVGFYSKQPKFATQSPDRQWLIVQPPGAVREFDVYNLNANVINPLRITLPRAAVTTEGENHTYELIEWSTDNRHLVVRHRFDNKKEFIVIDRQDVESSINISKRIPSTISFSSLRLRDKQFDSYYLYNDSIKTLQRYDLGEETATTVLTNVLAYHAHGDDELLYISNRNQPEGQVAVRMIEDGNTFTIYTMPAGKSYKLEVARYEDKWYLVASTSAEEKVYVFRDPMNLLRRDPLTKIVPAAVLKSKNTQHVSFSANARFIAAQSGSKFAVFDAEDSTISLYDSELTPTKGQHFVWMDGHRLTGVVNNSHYVFDYNGTNMHKLGSSYSNFAPYFTQNYEAVFTVTPSEAVEGRAAIERTELLIQEQ